MKKWVLKNYHSVVLRAAAQGGNDATSIYICTLVKNSSKIEMSFAETCEILAELVEHGFLTRGGIGTTSERYAPHTLTAEGRKVLEQ